MATWASLRTGDVMIATESCVDFESQRVFVIVRANNQDNGHLALELVDGYFSNIRDDVSEIEGWELIRA